MHTPKIGQHTPRPHRVVAVLYDRLCTFEFGCVVGVFGRAPAGFDRSWYEFSICGESRTSMRARGGFELAGLPGLRRLGQADTVIIPGWRDAREPAPAALVAALRAAHARGARLVSVCSGVFVLADTGLLDGRPATVHWEDADLLRRRFPRIDVRPDQLYTEQDRLITSAGSAAGLDMMLHIVRTDHGVKVANAVAQRLVIPRLREGNQAQYLPRLVAPAGDNAISSLMDWVRRNLAQPHDLVSLARRAHLSPRSLQRQFHQSTGLYPSQWLVRERVALARDYLENTRWSLWQIAEKTGLGSLESFRRHFRSVTGTTPGRYRAQFGR